MGLASIYANACELCTYGLTAVLVNKANNMGKCEENVFFIFIGFFVRLKSVAYELIVIKVHCQLVKCLNVK